MLASFSGLGGGWGSGGRRSCRCTSAGPRRCCGRGRCCCPLGLCSCSRVPPLGQGASRSGWRPPPYLCCWCWAWASSSIPAWQAQEPPRPALGDQPLPVPPPSLKNIGVVRLNSALSASLQVLLGARYHHWGSHVLVKLEHLMILGQLAGLPFGHLGGVLVLITSGSFQRWF